MHYTNQGNLHVISRSVNTTFHLKNHSMNALLDPFAICMITIFDLKPVCVTLHKPQTHVMNLRVLMRWNALIMNWCGVIWRRAYHSCRVTSSWVNKGCRHCLGGASCCGASDRRHLFLLPPLSSSIWKPYLQTGRWKSGPVGQFCLMAILFWY